MAIILFRCPFCSKKVETSEDNVGREGLCPGCQKIFEIPKPTQAEAARAARPSQGLGWLDSGPPEYQEMPVLIGVGVIALALLGLGAATLLDWLGPGAAQEAFVAGEKHFILLGSAACLAFMIVSALTRKSLMPAALTGAGWGMFALIWVGSIWHTMGSLAKEAGAKSSGVASGTYLTMAACLLGIAGVVFVYYQVRDSSILSRFGFFMVIIQVAALFGGLIVAKQHVAPAIEASAAAEAAIAPNAGSQVRQGRPPAQRPPGP